MAHERYIYMTVHRAIACIAVSGMRRVVMMGGVARATQSVLCCAAKTIIIVCSRYLFVTWRWQQVAGCLSVKVEI